MPVRSAVASASAVPALLHPRAPSASTALGVDIAAELRARIRGEVRFDEGSRALYATDGSNYRQVPIGVVIPRTTDDVLATIAVCRDHGVPIFARGGGTSLAGQCCNVAVAMDFSKYLDQVLHVDPSARRARVQPGLTLDHLRAATKPHGLTFGPDPATHQYCTLGGMIGNNSCGVHSVMSDFYGPGPTTAHNLDALEVVTYRGLRLRLGATSDAQYEAILQQGGSAADIYRQLKAFTDRYADRIREDFPDIPRRVSGYNLPALLPENGFNLARAIVGSECTLAVTLEATMHLIPDMPKRMLVVLGFADLFTAAEHVPQILEHAPTGLEGMDTRLTNDLRRNGLHADDLALLPQGSAWLLVEFGADTLEEARDKAEELVRQMRGSDEVRDSRTITDPDKQERLWKIRESGLGATAHVAGQEPTWPGWEDSAVSPTVLPAYLRDLDALYHKYGYHADLYGHFGQGCVHCRVDFDLFTAKGIATFRSFMEEAADLVHRHGGSLSGEHGDGQARGELLSRMFSQDMLQAFSEFKSIWDPDWKMNPGKIIDANPLDSHLRFGAGYDPPRLQTWFQFPHDRGNFAHAARRCVGVGKCRKDEAGTMCPSYQVTREERHATRGRAHLLFEMLEGDPLTGGWASEEVHEALDLCLACKGCKGECPVQVDMATYKAEFLSHYYETHRRPRSAYAFGWIHTWAMLAALAPRAVNWFTQTPPFGGLAKFVAGVAPERRIPSFAPHTFREWFLTRPAPEPGPAGRVILWPDTFNDHFHPETAKAAVRVLERAGFTVEIPRAALCCGRPLYDYGMLATARERLRTILTSLHNEIRDGVPIVGLEPSCVAVFRDELTNLFPDDLQALRLSKQTLLLGEFLAQHIDRLPSGSDSGHALLHGHCHQKALIGMTSDQQVLDRVGIHAETPDSGCCGMAGGFGFEATHYDVSRAVGERRLLPAVRQASADTVIIADGFSCREQIEQCTDRRPLHLAEVLDMAATGRLDDKPASRQSGAGGSRADLTAFAPEYPRGLRRIRSEHPVGRALLAAVLVGAIVVLRRRLSTPHEERTWLKGRT